MPSEVVPYNNEDDDLIPHVQSQIKVSRNPGDILFIPNKMVELVLIIHKIILSEH